MWCFNSYFGGYMMFFWFITIGIFLFMILAFLKNSSSSTLSRRSSIDVLKERYAKGEITKKEFDDMKKDIV